MGMKELLGMITQDKKKLEREKTAKQIAISVGIAVIAAAAGVATGILLAPKSGKETWEDLKKNCKFCKPHQGFNGEEGEGSDVANASNDTEMKPE